MLRIKPKQMEAFERQALAGVQLRLQRVVAGVFPALDPARPNAPPDAQAQLAAVVDQGIESAVAHGLRACDEWAAFIALGLGLRAHGPGATPEWVADCLKRDDTPGPARLAMVQWYLAEQGRSQPGLAQVQACMARARQAAQGS